MWALFMFIGAVKLFCHFGVCSSRGQLFVAVLGIGALSYRSARCYRRDFTIS